jgi:hypothetical protein
MFLLYLQLFDQSYSQPTSSRSQPKDRKCQTEAPSSAPVPPKQGTVEGIDRTRHNYFLERRWFL